MITKLKLGDFVFLAYAFVFVLCRIPCSTSLTEFNITLDRFSNTGFKLNNGLEPFSTNPIHLQNKHFFRVFVKPDFSNLKNLANTTTRVKNLDKKKYGAFAIITFIALPACIIMGIILFFFMCWKKYRQHPIKNEDSEMGLSLRASSDREKVSLDKSHYYTFNKDRIFHNTLLESYSFDELRKATEDFDASNLIDGSVYHGRLNGKEMAIKRISPDIISRTDFSIFDRRTYRHHPNVIDLLGVCAMDDGPDSFLVLEYAKNGSLKDWIFKGLAIKSRFIHSCNCFLTWDQRLKICLDVAVAMKYLHGDIEPSYVHGHIRSRNVFLDDEFNAKIGNLGMVPSCVEPENEVDEGYLAPEYLIQGANAISSAIDVFAYGVVLLEVLSGKRAMRRVDETGEGGVIHLCNEIKQVLGSGDREILREWMDSVLGEDYSVDRAVMLANIAKLCVEDDPFLRPSAEEIVGKLLSLK